MGEQRRDAFRVGFDRSVTLEFRGAHVTSDAGVLALRELDAMLGLTQLAGGALVATRTDPNTRHGLVAQLRQTAYKSWAGYEDTTDAGNDAWIRPSGSLLRPGERPRWAGRIRREVEPIP